MTHDEMIAVIQAHKEGKPIEVRNRSQAGRWYPSASPAWDFSTYNYRMKVEPVVRWGVEDKSGFFVTTYESEDRAKQQYPPPYRVYKMVEVIES